ncbi:MAG: outer membrane scaffolding protein for murein synthesis (MipA/OmpV family) [Bacteriovoracaceae bacterium]|jgi:outer membrane scaffolding protein for murein synthesis (MipA/OmpV family)
MSGLKFRRGLPKMRLVYFLLVILSFHANAFEWTEVSLGLGVYRYDNIRVDNRKKFLKKDPIYEPVPIVQLRVGPFVINKDGAGFALLYFKKIKLVGVAIYEGEAYETLGMEERKKSFYLGGGFQFYDLEGLYYQDVQSRSRGKVYKLSYAPKLTFNQYTFSPRIYAQLWNQNYVDYFFGVRSNEVNQAIGRFQFTGKKSINYGFMLRNIWTVENLKYVLSAGYKFYDKSVYNSPTVSKDIEQRIFLGIMYKLY